jgi:hypothetical protein
LDLLDLTIVQKSTYICTSHENHYSMGHARCPFGYPFRKFDLSKSLIMHHRAQRHFTRALTKLTMACSQHVCVHKYIKYLHNSSSVSSLWNETCPLQWSGCSVFWNASPLLHSFPPDIHWVYITGKNDFFFFCYQCYYMQGNALEPSKVFLT